MNSEENEDQRLPDGWVLCQSKSNPGRRYFFNTRTGKSSWTQPQAEDEYDQKKQKGKKEKPNFREIKKRLEYQMKYLKRKSDGDEDSLSNKKQRPESTPEAISPFSPTKPPTPARYTEPKPIDKEPCLKPILTKNSANARLSQLRARLSSEAQASQEVQPPTENLRTIGMAAPFTEQRYVRFDLKSPPLNEFKCTTRTPRSDGLSPSSSQFLAANKIISSMKAHLPDQFRNMKPKDTFADIEEGICNQTAEYPFMKHPATPPQFSEASKLVSAIKSKLSYTPMDDRARSFMSNKEYVEKIKSFIAAKEQVFRKEKLSNPYLTQDQINHNNHETRAFMQQKNYSGNREVQINSFVSNKEAINCRNDKPVTCTSNIRPTDPRQDKLRAFISNVRHLNDMENIKQSTRIPTQEHINFSEYKARNCMPNRTNTTQSNRVEATVKTNVPIIQNTEDCQKTQIASTSIGDNGRTTIPNIKSFEHNVITQAPSTHSMASDIKNKITNRPIPNQINMEGERQTPTINKLIVDNNLRVPVVRIPISDRLKVDLKQGICTTNRPNMEDTRTFTSNKEQQENKSGITKPSPAEENVKMFTQTRPQIADELRPATHVIEKTEEKVRNHLSNEDKTENKLNSSKTSQQTMSDPLVNNMIHAHEADLNLTNQSTIQIEKVLESNTSSDEESDEEDESIEMPIEENIMTSIEEQLEKMDQKSPQNQNIVNHRKEDSLEPILKSTFTARNQTPTFESNIDIESPSTQNLDALTEEAPVIEPTKVTKFMSDESIVSLLSDESSSSESEKETEDKSEDEIVTYSSAKDRMDSLRNRLSKEAEITEMPEITDIEFLNSIKLPSPNVITDEEYLNMIELPKYPSEAMEVDCKEDLESTSYSCPKNVMDPDADIVLVVDTNIFIHELDVIKNVLNSHIKGYTRQPTLLVPWRVINELDRLKDNNNGNGAICTRARAAMDYLYKSLPENDRIKGQSLRDSNSHIYPCESPDDEILNCCLQQAERGKSVILLSNDKNLCNKAAVNAVRCIELDELRPLLQSTPRPSADPDLCAGVKHCEAAMYALLANILENEMRAKYNNLWQHVIFKAPPWSLTDVLHCLLKHWIAVFNEVFPRIEHLLTDLKNTVVCIENKDPKSLTQSEVANFKELCLEIAKKCLIIPEYMGLAKATLERLHRKPNEEAPEMVVIEAFEQLWTVFSSYCAQLCSAVGLECSLEDKLGGACTARQLGERWQVYSAQLYALTLAIKGALCTDKEELTEEQVDDLEDVFKECCALVEADGSKVNKENIRVFCTKCRNMLQEASAKFCGLTELLTVCKQRMETM